MMDARILNENRFTQVPSLGVKKIKEQNTNIYLVSIMIDVSKMHMYGKC